MEAVPGDFSAEPGDADFGVPTGAAADPTGAAAGRAAGLSADAESAGASAFSVGGGGGSACGAGFAREWSPLPRRDTEHADRAEAEREVLQAEYANSQGRAEFYEANPPESGNRNSGGWKQVGPTIETPVKPGDPPVQNGCYIADFSIADLMRPKV